MRAVVSLLAALALLPLGRAAAQPSPEASPGTAAAEARKEAARLFAEGRALHQAGDYASAIAKFRRANDLAPDPLVLFAIAQAQRLAGDCAARDTYASFLAAAPATSLRASVEKHIAELSTRCPASPAPVFAAPSAPAMAAAPPVPRIALAPTEPPAGPARPPESVADSLVVASRDARPEARPERRSRTWALVAAGGAFVAGATASWAYLSNNGRMDTWRGEDEVLAAPPPLGTTAAAWFERQSANNDLARSIERRDQLGVGLLVTAGALAVTSVVTYLMGR
jgi:hypothetical protein